MAETTSRQRLSDLLSDGGWHGTDELQRAAGPRFGARLHELRAAGLLSREQEVELHGRHRIDASARDQLVASNQGLVFLHARPFAKGRHDIDDQVQEGNLGLLKAIEKFSPARGIRFATYATWWVRAYLLRFVHYRSMVQSQRAKSFDLSLDATGPDGETPLIERLEADEQPVDETLAAHELRQQVRGVLERLHFKRDGLSWDIVQERLLTDRSTLDDLGSRYGISRERVRQVELQVRARLSRHLGDAFQELVA